MTKPKPDKYRAGQIGHLGRVVCGAKKSSDGQPCQMPVQKGHTRCKHHGGSTPQAKAAAARRNAENDARKAVRRLGYDPDAPNVDPAEELLRLVSHKAREVAWLRQSIDAYSAPGATDADRDQAWSLAYGVVKQESGVGPMGPVDTITTGPRLDTLVEWLHKAEDALARHAKTTLDAGVQERQVRVEETQAAMVVTAIQTILGALQLTPDQQALVPTVVPAALRALEPA